MWLNPSAGPDFQWLIPRWSWAGSKIFSLPLYCQQNQFLRANDQLCSRDHANIDVASADYFVYHGRENERILTGLTHVKIDLSVRAMKDYAFFHRKLLLVVILNDRLEEIGYWAFRECALLVLYTSRYPAPSRRLTAEPLFAFWRESKTIAP